MTKEEVIAKQPDFTQLCVWPACTLGENTPQEFVEFMKAELNTRVLFMEQVFTLPGDDGEGGRSDLFFYAHNEDIGHFSIPRLQMGIRWWEDVLDNMADHGDRIYTEEVFEKYPYMWEDHSLHITENSED